MLVRGFRTFGWVSNAALLLASAWLAADLAGTLAGFALRPRPTAPALAEAAPPPAPAPAPEFGERIYRLIGVAPPPAAGAEDRLAVNAGPRCEDAGAAPVRSGLGLGLVAALLAEDPRRSLATLVETGTRQAHLVAVGERIASALFLGLVRVYTNRESGGEASHLAALICNGGVKEYVGPEAAAAPSPAPALASARPPAPEPFGIRRTGPDRWEIPRRSLEAALGDVAARAADARFVPALQGGAMRGFRALAVQPGSFIAGMGIEDGDVIRRIDGYAIDSAQKLLELYQRIPGASRVTVEVERAGQIVRREYLIAGP